MMGYTLPNLLAEIDGVAALHPQEYRGSAAFIAAAKDYLTRLYGDDPEKFDGPDELDMGVSYIDLRFMNEDAGRQHALLSLVWNIKTGELKAICKITIVNEYSGIETTLRNLQEACAM